MLEGRIFDFIKFVFISIFNKREQCRSQPLYAREYDRKDSHIKNDGFIEG